MPKVSVVIATYNRARLLIEAMESVLNQTYSDLEVIVVDDGSTDDTESAIQDLLARRPQDKPRVRYFWQENRGQTVAANNGIEWAAGEWVGFLDSDDRWLPDKLSLQLEALEQVGGGCDACITDAGYINNPALTKTAFEHVGRPYAGSAGVILDPLQRVVNGWHGMYLQTLIVRKNILGDVGGFDPKLNISYDLDFLFRLAARTKVCYVTKPLVEIDRTPHRSDGMIERFHDEEYRLRNYQRLYEKWLLQDHQRKLGVGNLIRRQLQGVHSNWATWHLLNGNNPRARQAMWASLRYNTTGKIAFKWLLTAVTPRLVRNIAIKKREAAPELVFG